MSVIEREKMLRRLEMCKTELKRAKQAIGFWSHELKLVVDAIADGNQFNFEEYFNERDNNHESK